MRALALLIFDQLHLFNIFVAQFATQANASDARACVLRFTIPHFASYNYTSLCARAPTERTAGSLIIQIFALIERVAISHGSEAAGEPIL
jgi:hypothetical protein